MTGLRAPLALLAVALTASTAAVAGAGPLPAAAGPGAYVVTVSGTLQARTASSTGKEATGFSLDVRRRSVSYRWTERLTETLAAGRRGAASRSDRMTGSGRATIYFHMRHVNFKDIQVGCAMKLGPARQIASGFGRLTVRADPATGSAKASGLLPVDDIRSSYDGPVSIGGFATPCFEARPLDWAGLIGLPLHGQPQTPPFRPLTCTLGRVGSSCSAPFSYVRTWPVRNGSVSLHVRAVLRARRLARAPASR